MFDWLEDEIGHEIILWFQNNRSGWMEVLSQVLDQLGADLGYVFIFALVFLAINKRHGIRMIFALVTIALVTFILKDIFERPRPFDASFLVIPVFEPEGYGFPSGHAAFAVMIAGYVALWQRKTWVWILAILYMLLHSIARPLAGVHYLHDVVAGIVIGIVMLAIYYPVADRWEDFWNRQGVTMRMIIALVVPLVIAGIVMALPLEPFQVEEYMTILGIALGAGIGTVIESSMIKFEIPDAILQKVIIFVCGVAASLALLFALDPVFDQIAANNTIAYMLRIVRYSLAAYVAIAVIPMLAIRFNILQSDMPAQEEVVAEA